MVLPATRFNTRGLIPPGVAPAARLPSIAPLNQGFNPLASVRPLTGVPGPAPFAQSAFQPGPFARAPDGRPPLAPPVLPPNPAPAFVPPPAAGAATDRNNSSPIDRDDPNAQVIINVGPPPAPPMDQGRSEVPIAPPATPGGQETVTGNVESNIGDELFQIKRAEDRAERIAARKAAKREENIARRAAAKAARQKIRAEEKAAAKAAKKAAKQAAKQAARDARNAEAGNRTPTEKAAGRVRRSEKALAAAKARGASAEEIAEIERKLAVNRKSQDRIGFNQSEVGQKTGKRVENAEAKLARMIARGAPKAEIKAARQRLRALKDQRITRRGKNQAGEQTDRQKKRIARARERRRRRKGKPILGEEDHRVD